MEPKVDVSIWHNSTMRNGFEGSMHWRTMKVGGQTQATIIMTAKHLAANQNKYMCDFPAELIPAREIPLSWSQPRNNDFTHVGASIGGSNTSIKLNFVSGGSGDLYVDFYLVYWLDTV